MEDRQILARVSALVTEEHELEQRHAGAGLDAAERDRLAALEVELDTCWDLLRQRRARRAAGLDPDRAAPRDERVVEGYQQ